MIPKKLDYTKDECRGALRHLELQAYSSVISTFRAQGSLDNNKQGVLDQLRKCFHISEDRHKAEARRVANHEKLTTISEILNGKSYDLEWIREGHRSYPLISRAPSYTALHLLADHASKIAEFENSELPTPSETKRERNLSVSEISGVPIVIDDQTKPPSIPTPAIFGISKKDLKRNIDLVTLHPHGKKKHYHHLKPPPPPPNMKIQHLYQTLNTKRPRKSFTKKSLKTKNSKQSPGSSAAASRLQFPYPPMLHSSPLSSDEKQNFDELQRHLTSTQLMPPPMSPMKLNAYAQQSTALPTTPSGSKNLLKINHQQQIEPQAHYIPNNRLKGELLAEHHHHPQQSMPPTSSRARSGRSKSVNVSATKGNYSQKYSNGAGMRNNSMDHIPDPQIIFNTSSSKSPMEPPQPSNSSHVEVSIPIESNEMDLSPAITSPLQLLSTAASCTPKLKINASPNVNHQTQYHQLPSSTLPTNTTTVLTNHQQQQQSTSSALKSVQNRAIKIIPANAKPVIIKPQQQQQQMSDPTNKIQPVPQQIITASTGTPSKFKIQKIQLVMNKNQDGTASTSLSPSATFVSGKAGQLVLSGKGITNTYQVGGPKPPYTILSSAPKVIVQTIDRNFAQQKEENVTTDRIPENQRITENTPIDFLPVATAATTTTSSNTPSSFPKVIIPSTANATTTTIAPKQIKLKLGPGSIVNSKIFKGPLPTNLKIQRNINTKGFTVLNTLNPSQIVQIQSTVPASSIASIQSPPSTTSKVTQSSPAEITPVLVSVASNESTKTDWEQELDDVNRSKKAESKERHVSVSDASNGNAPAAKKSRIEENVMEIVPSTDDSMIVESTEEETESSSNVIYAENLPQVEEEEIHEQTPTAEYLYLNTVDSELKQSTEDNPEQDINGEEIEETLANGQFDIQEERGHNGAEAYENLVKSLTECDGDYMKDMSETQIEENFGLIDSNMLETITFNRESEGLFQ